jgi:NitT/TauT family transport system substrate-binding protein
MVKFSSRRHGRSRALVGVALALCFAVAGGGAARGGRQGGPAQPAPAQPLPADAPFTVAVATSTLEAAPVYIAVARGGQANYRFINGGVRSLLNGGAHAATNAETQMLLAIDANPKIRMLFTLTDGLYRIVAKRSSGIRTLADLKGKRVVVPRNTSAHYSLVRLLATAGVQESEVTLVNAPATEMALAMVKGEADAISMWEPESQNAVDALGSDAIEFSGKGVYREGFSFYSSTDVLNDARRRRELVGFVRALLTAVDALTARPAEFFPLISNVTRHPRDQIARSWEHHAFPMVIPADMLDVVTLEEQWIAKGQQRAPKTRAQLQTYFDGSVLEEARKPNQPSGLP